MPTPDCHEYPEFWPDRRLVVYEIDQAICTLDVSGDDFKLHIGERVRLPKVWFPRFVDAAVMASQLNDKKARQEEAEGQSVHAPFVAYFVVSAVADARQVRRLLQEMEVVIASH